MQRPGIRGVVAQISCNSEHALFMLLIVSFKVEGIIEQKVWQPIQATTMTFCKGAVIAV